LIFERCPRLRSIVIGLMIIDPTPHQPCHMLFAVMSRCAAMPQRRQNGPRSLRKRITTMKPWWPRIVASTAGTAPQKRQLGP
jgi:hypothetical protein